MATTHPPDTDSDPPSTGDGDSAQRAQRDLAELAFGRPAQVDELTRRRPLGLLPVESLELDLSDPAQRQFGDYELLEQIGKGGMGVVYRARQVSLDRQVAIKLLSAGPWASRDFIARFEREAQNAARMQHPCIVTIYEVGSNEHLHFFSMQLVRGQSLADMVRKHGPLGSMRAARLTGTIAEALAYAHGLGVLHLDLKPANVLLDEDGTPHVADFGLARRLDSALAMENEDVSGTPSYMAPEQAHARSHILNAATDIWGLGAILYELVTGAPPFRAGSAQETLRLVLEGTVRRPRRSQPHLPLDLEAVILKCLAHEPSARYASARALADDLARFIEHRSVLARPLNPAQRLARWARREPKLAATAMLAVSALVIGLIATTQQWRRAEGNARLAANSAVLANDRLWQARLDQAESDLRNGRPYAALPGLAANISEREALGLDASDDRLRIAMVAHSAPQLIDVITVDASITGVGLSPDGKLAAVAGNDSTLRLFDTASGHQKWNTALTGVPFVVTRKPVLVALQFTPDGRRILGHGYWGGAELDLPAPIGELEALIDATTGKQLLPPE
ncbi:MAG: serine/threonine-protein kinase, partial [Rhodanobacter sp.]